MGHTFVSYARTDESFVSTLLNALEHKGLSLWSDDRIAPGDHYDDVIDAALEAADKVLVVWSASSVQSQWVRAEASEGLRRHVLIPITIDEARIPLEFRRLQTIDFSGWAGNPDAAEFQALTTALTQGSASPATAPKELGDEMARIPARGAPPSHRRRVGRPLGYALLGLAVVILSAVVFYWLAESPSPTPTLAILDVEGSEGVPAGLPSSLKDELATGLGNDSRLSLIESQPNEGAASDFALVTTVRRSDDQLRFTVKLLDATRRQTLLSQQVDRPYSDWSKAAQQVASMVSATVACGLSEQGTASKLGPAALTARLQLCKEEYEEQSTLAGLYSLAKRITELAPQSSRAWADRASYASAAVLEGDAAARQDVMQSAKRALQLDPKNSLVYGAYAELLPQNDLIGREKLFRRGVTACSVDCASELFSLGWFLLQVGRVNEATSALVKAYELDGNGPDSALSYAQALMAEGRYLEAREILSSTLSRWPDRDILHWALLRAAVAADRYEEARSLIRSRLGDRDLSARERAAWLAAIDALEGDASSQVDPAALSISELSKSPPTTSAFNVIALSKLGKRPQALEAALALVEYDSYWREILFWQLLDGTRSSPKLYTYLNYAGLLAYWRASKKPPDFCRSRIDTELCKELR